MVSNRNFDYKNQNEEIVFVKEFESSMEEVNVNQLGILHFLFFLFLIFLCFRESN